MAIKDAFKVSRKTFFNPTAWLNLNALKMHNKMIWDVLKNLFTKPVPGTAVSFEEAMKQQGLTEKDIADGISTYRALAVVFLVLALASLAYAVYLVFYHGSLTGCLLSLAVTALLASQVFKYDFWALQMRRRHLGLTFADWKRQYLGD